MDELLDMIDASFQRNSICLSHRQKEQFKIYCTFLLEYNKKVNLTALTQKQEIINMHFIDSLAAMHLPELIPNAICADIGTGAGFPGVPLAIARPDIQVALIDSLKKRLIFLDELKSRLGLSNINTIHGRSEDLAHTKGLRENFDCVFSRAVARMNVLSEYVLPFVKTGGYMLAWKGPAFAQELEEAKNALMELGAAAEKIYTADLENRQHFIIAVKKTKAMQKKYPRQAGTPKRKPL